jgi:uncharacterized protein (DUF983 family)
MSHELPGAPPTLVQAALGCRCPRCGKGPLFQGLLTVRPRCLVCGLDLSRADTGDGATVFIILLLGAVMVGLAFWVEFTFNPPLWVHAVLWPVLIIPAAIALMRPTKAALVFQQYHNRASEMGR